MNAISELHLNASPAALTATGSTDGLNHNILDTVDDLLSRLCDMQALVGSIDKTFLHTMVHRSEESGDRTFIAEADQMVCLLSVVAREIEAARALIDNKYPAFLNARPDGWRVPKVENPKPDTSAWDAARDVYVAVEAVDISDMPDAEAEAVADLESDALKALVSLRASTVAALHEKMEILKRTDTFINEGFVDELLLDAAALS